MTPFPPNGLESRPNGLESRPNGLETNYKSKKPLYQKSKKPIKIETGHKPFFMYPLTILRILLSTEKMSTTCLIHGEISSWNGRSITCGGAFDWSGNSLTCTCVKAPPPLCEMKSMPFPPSWLESRPLRHCHRVENYKSPKDLPVDACCMCGECESRSRATTEELFALPRSDDGHLSPMIRGGSSSTLRSMTGTVRLRSATGGGSSNSLERTGACTPQCSCEISATPCGDRQESEEEPYVLPDKRTDSVIGITFRGGLARSPMNTDAERMKQD